MTEHTQIHRDRLATVDHEAIRQLAIAARDGDPKATPAIEPTREAPEIGRRIARALMAAHRDDTASDEDRNAAYANLVGLAGIGAREYGARLLKENILRVTRQGATLRIHSGGFLPESVVSNGHADVSPAVDNEAAGKARGRKLHVEFDFMTWEMFDILLEQARTLRDGLDAVVVTLEEIAKLKTMYPKLTVGDAMAQVGLDPATLEINLDLIQQPDAAADAS